MKNDKILAVVKKPNLDMEVIEIDNSLKNYQELVEGHIEVVPFPNLERVDIIVNEEGKLENLEPNVFVPDYDDLLVGNVIIVGCNEDGEFISLNDMQIAVVKNYMARNSAIEYEGNIADFITADVLAPKPKEWYM